MDGVVLLVVLASLMMMAMAKSCRLIGREDFLEFSKDGDLIIGGIFSMTVTRKLNDNQYRAVPQTHCIKWNDRELKFARTVMFTVDEINGDSRLLPGVSLGYRIFNGCGSENLIRAAVSAITGGHAPFTGGHAPVDAVTGSHAPVTGGNAPFTGGHAHVEAVTGSHAPLDAVTGGHAPIDAVTRGHAPVEEVTGGHAPITGGHAPVEAVTGGHAPVTGSHAPCGKPVQALIGHSSSGVSEDINLILSPLGIPQISHLSTCACLSDRRLYPTFFRTVPSDRFQIRGLVGLMRRLGWRWVGVLHSVGLYAQEGAAQFSRQAAGAGICVEFTLAHSKTNPKNMEVILETLDKATAKVVLLFMSLSYTRSFLEEVEHRNISGVQFVGTESWITQAELASVGRKSILQGAVGFALPQAAIPGLGHFLLGLRPRHEPHSAIIRAFWEKFFSCSFNATSAENAETPPCTGSEDLSSVSSDYTSVRQFREENNVYKAVYLVAYALHALLQCHNGSNPTNGKRCVEPHNVRPQMVLDHILHVNFTTRSGMKVSFDDNGDSVAQYDLVNWQMKDDGSVDIVTIGRYDTSEPEGAELSLHDHAHIVWGGGGAKPVRSVCREPCPPGTRKAMNKLKPVCCFDCFPCPEGTISNSTDSPDCLVCPPELWPNENQDACLPKPTEFLSNVELMGALLTAVSLIGAFLSLLTSIVFLTHKETPIVRANNSELSFLLLLALALCFLCSLTFIGAPSRWSCMLRHTAFGITFVLCISCILGKTVVVLMAFRAKLPGSHVMKWLGPAQQRLSVVAFTLVQVGICSVWLAVSPPFPVRNLSTYKDRIILECDLGSAVGFWAVLGYVGLLAVFCFALATLARKLPDTFNEAKFITFSMLIFCAVWIAFIPAYVSSPGKFTVAVEIFAILASSYGMLICIFFPKCYIIIFRPEQNSKKHLMGKIPARTL